MFTKLAKAPRLLFYEPMSIDYEHAKKDSLPCLRVDFNLQYGPGSITRSAGPGHGCLERMPRADSESSVLGVSQRLTMTSLMMM